MTDSQWSTFLFLNGAQMGILLAIFMNDDDPAERVVAIEMDFNLIGICDEIWAFGLDRPTEGMRAEIRWAEGTGVPVLDGFKMIGRRADHAKDSRNQE